MQVKSAQSLQPAQCREVGSIRDVHAAKRKLFQVRKGLQAGQADNGFLRIRSIIAVSKKELFYISCVRDPDFISGDAERCENCSFQYGVGDLYTRFIDHLQSPVSCI